MRSLLVLGLVAALAGCGKGSPSATGHSSKAYRVQGAGPGPLFLIGGGDDAPPVLRRFMTLAGGLDAPVVVVALAGDATGEAGLRAVGATHVTTFKGDVASLSSAGGLYFSGGVPDRLLTGIAPYLGAVKSAWQAGAVVGGSSAGAMAWGSRLIQQGETDDALAKGAAGLALEDGLGLWPGAIVDPHFNTRGRFDRLFTACGDEKALGVGIDEQTAAELAHDGTLAVWGVGGVTVMQPQDGAARVTVVPSGHTLDLNGWQ